MNISKDNIIAIKKLCKELKVKNFCVFGSALNNTFSKDSDIDFIVDFEEKDPLAYSDLYFKLKEKLENLLNRQIDLIEERGIKNSFFKREIEDTKVVIYG